MTNVRVRLLGDVAVEQDGVVATSGSGAMRTLLALLALDPGALVAVDTLVEELWPEGRGPQHPAATLHTRITRLRNWLGGPRLVTGHAGAYTLRLPPEAIDLAAFHSAAERALALGVPPEEALAAADAALALWAGEPLPGLDAPRIGAERARTCDRHLAVVERRIRALIDLGRADEAVDAVGPIALEHPVRESLQALRVAALDRAGRPRDAVEAYLATCRTLSEDLAVGPGAELRAAYHRVIDRRSTTAGPAWRQPTMVGRDAALGRIVDALAADGRLVLVEGEAGIGKSVLLAAARHAADATTARVVAGAWQDDVTPMAAWFEALGWPPASLAQTPGPWVRDRLVRLSHDAPLLVTLDDAHRADSGSLGVLTLLARIGVPAGVVVVVAARSPDTVPHPGWDATLAELVRAEQTVRLPLDVLDPGSVRDVAVARLTRFGAGPAARLAALVVERAGGHPLHAAALLDVLETRRDTDSAIDAARTVPERLRAIVHHQVARLPAPTRTGLEALAVLAPIDLSALADVLDRRPLALAADLRPAVDAGIAVSGDDGVSLRHDLVADAVREGVPPATRTVLHRTRLDQLPDDAAVFVRLRHATGAAAVLPAGDLARVRVDAGVAAFRVRALTEALALFEQAAADLDGDRELAVHRGLVLGALGRTDEADEVLDGALAVLLADDDPDVRLMVIAAVGDEPLGRTVAGDPRRLDRLRRVERRSLPPAPRFELLASLVREEMLSGRPRPDGVAEMRELVADDGVGATIRARARALEARMLVGVAPVGEGLAAAGEAHALAESTGDPLLLLEATEALMTTALCAGQVERALALRAHMAAEAERWHRPRMVWGGHLVEAALRLAEGDVEGADLGALTGLRRGQELGVADAPTAYGVHLMVRHWLLGTADEVVDVAARATVALPAIPAWCAAAAVAAARAGRTEQAWEFLAEFRRRRTPTASRAFDRPALCFAAGAAFTLGCTRTAELVVDGLLADPEAIVLVGCGVVVMGPVTLFTGLAAWTLGDLEGARAAFAAAEALTTRLGWVPWADAAGRLGSALDAQDTVDLPLGLAPVVTVGP